MQQLIAALEAHASELTELVLRDMYRDAFWDARYGARGLRFAREDGLHHVSHLIQALIAEDHQLFIKYARWLRSVLTSRGMCSLHISDNFERLACAITERIPESAAACAVLRAGGLALEYTSGPAGELNECTPWLLDACAAVSGEDAEASEVAPGPAASGGAATPEFRRYEARKLLSHMADCIDVRRPDRFREHLAWLSSYAGEQGLPTDYYSELTDCLIDRLVTDPARSPELKASVRELRAQRPREYAR